MRKRTAVRAVTRPARRGGAGRRTACRRLALERLEERRLLATFTVTRALDDTTTQGTLRWAIDQANSTAGPDLIAFDLSDAEGRTITLATALPTISDTVTIRGLPEGSAGIPPTITVTGAGSLDANGFRVNAPDVVISGLVINGFRQNGILIQGVRATVTNCYIGVDLTGATAVPNGGSGILVTGTNGVTIGGDSQLQGNLISGNAGAGVALESGVSLSRVVGNRIGINLAGDSALPNGEGVRLATGAQANTVGGAVASEANVIAGNTGPGVLISGGTTRNNVLIGNRIGVNSGATAAIGNEVGVLVRQASDNRIGGTVAGEGNVIAGNRGEGVRLEQAAGTLLQGNLIGTNPGAQASTLGNGGFGVRLIGSSGNQIGSLDATGGNTIAFNGTRVDAAGIGIDDNSRLNPILSNSIFNNNGLGIDLGEDGPDTNDRGDGDTGANDRQNFPVLTRVSTAAGRTLIQGSLSSTPNSSFLVQFFSNPVNDPSGRGEGRTLVGSVVVSTNGAGDALINATIAVPTTVGQFLTATATTQPAQEGNTSEFSPGIAIIAAQVADLSVTIEKQDDGSGLPPNQALIDLPFTYLVRVANSGPERATNVRLDLILPTAVAYVSSTTTQGTIAPGTTGLVGSLGAIEVGDQVVIRVTVRPILASDAATATAIVSGTQLDPIDFDNTATSIIRIINPANLAIEASAEEPVVEDGPLVYTVNITNLGPNQASNVVLTANLPAGVSFEGAFSSQGESSVNSGVLTAQLGSIDLLSTVTVRVFLRTSDPGTITQRFDVRSPDDPDQSNNSAVVTTNVQPRADLRVTLAASPVEVVTGTDVVYEALVTNDGPRAATNVRLVADVPGALTNIRVLVNGAPVSGLGNPLIVPVGTIAVGATARVQILATPAAGASGLVGLTVTVAADEGDLSTDDNRDSADVFVNPANLSVQQFAQPDPPLVNQPLAYFVTVRNDGLADATNVVLTNLLPAGVILDQAATEISLGVGSLQFFADRVIATFPSLLAGASAQIRLVVTPTSSASFTNIASVAADQIDPDTSNNTSSLELIASPTDMAVALESPPPSTVFVGDALSLRYRVTNNGPAPATLASLRLPLPAALSFTSASSTQGTAGFDATTRVVTANLGNLAPGASAIVTVVVQPTFVGAVVATATVDSAELDNVATNDSAAFAADVVNAPGSLQFSAAVFQAPENSGVATITLTRSGGAQGNVSVAFATQGGTAVPGVNYTPVSGVVNFLEGQTTATFEVPLLVDGRVTAPLTVGLVLSSPTGGASIGPISTATLQIVNTDIDSIAPTVNALRLDGPGASVRQVTLVFSEPLNPGRAANPANYRITGPRGAGVGIAEVIYVPGSNQVTLVTASLLRPGGFFRLLVNGSAPGGITDAAGNFLAGNGQSAGTNYAASFGRGTAFSFNDSDGDLVNLSLRNGGVLEVIRSSSGDVQVLRASGYRRQSTLSGSVRRTMMGGNGSTVIGEIQNIPFGSLRSRLTSPPFFVTVQYGNLRPPVQIASFPARFRRG